MPCCLCTARRSLEDPFLSDEPEYRDPADSAPSSMMDFSTFFRANEAEKGLCDRMQLPCCSEQTAQFWVSAINRTCTTGLSLSIFAKLIVGVALVALGIFVLIFGELLKWNGLNVDSIVVLTDIGMWACEPARAWLIAAAALAIGTGGLQLAALPAATCLFGLIGLHRDARDLPQGSPKRERVIVMQRARARCERLCTVIDLVMTVGIALAYLFIEGWSVYGAFLFFPTRFGDEGSVATANATFVNVTITPGGSGAGGALSGGASSSTSPFAVCPRWHQMGYVLSAAGLAFLGLATAAAAIACCAGLLVILPGLCCLCKFGAEVKRTQRRQSSI